jgi:hypothetical protein
MGKPMVDMTIRNGQCDRLRVLIKDGCEELVFSRGEVAYVFAAGVGSLQPTFNLVTAEDYIEISASNAEGYFLTKEPPKSKNSGMQPRGVWDRELDGGR